MQETPSAPVPGAYFVSAADLSKAGDTRTHAEAAMVSILVKAHLSSVLCLRIRPKDPILYLAC